MDRSLAIPESLYERLEASASRRGLKDIAQLIEEWQALEEQRQNRSEVIRQIDSLRERLLAKYGEMPDSSELIREDRER